MTQTQSFGYWPNDLWSPLDTTPMWEVSLRRIAQLQLLIAGATTEQLNEIRIMPIDQLIVVNADIPGMAVDINQQFPPMEFYALEYIKTHAITHISIDLARTIATATESFKNIPGY